MLSAGLRGTCSNVLDVRLSRPPPPAAPRRVPSRGRAGKSAASAGGAPFQKQAHSQGAPAEDGGGEQQPLPAVQDSGKKIPNQAETLFTGSSETLTLLPETDQATSSVSDLDYLTVGGPSAFLM